MLGYCFGGLLSVIWTALYPDAVKNLVTLATPIDASVEGSPLYTWPRACLTRCSIPSWNFTATVQPP